MKAVVRGVEWSRAREHKPAVTKYQQKDIKNVLRLPIKRDYSNKFESLVAIPYRILRSLCLILAASFTLEAGRSSRTFPSTAFRVKSFLKHFALTQIVERSINICVFIIIFGFIAARAKGGNQAIVIPIWSRTKRNAPSLTIIIEWFLTQCQMSA